MYEDCIPRRAERRKPRDEDAEQGLEIRRRTYQSAGDLGPMRRLTFGKGPSRSDERGYAIDSAGLHPNSQISPNSSG